MTPTVFLTPGKGGKTTEVLQTFARGCGADVRTYDGTLPDGPAVIYGVMPSTMKLWQDLNFTRHPYLYIDNGYFGSTYEGGEHFSITWNAPRHSGMGRYSDARYQAMGAAVCFDDEKVHRVDDFVLIALQSGFWYERHGTNVYDWCADVGAAIRTLSDRGIVVRAKPGQGIDERVLLGKMPRGTVVDFDADLADLLADTRCVVTHSSNVALKGLQAGVPCIATSDQPTHLHAVSHSRYPSQVEFATCPGYDHLQDWAVALCANQWTLAEMADGTAWGDLQERRAAA